MKNHDQKSCVYWLKRLHRRRFAWRLVEHAALGTICGAVISLLIIAIFWQRRSDGFNHILTTIAFGAVAGILVALRRPISLRATAELIDARLKTNDLFSSALMVDRSSDEFARTLHAIADAACMNLRDKNLVMRRFTQKTWSAIGLTFAAVVTLALIARPQAIIDSAAVAADVKSASVDPQIARIGEASNSTQSHDNEPTPANAQPESVSQNSRSDGISSNVAAANGAKQSAGSAGRGGGSATSQFHERDDSESNTNAKDRATASGLTNQTSDGAATDIQTRSSTNGDLNSGKITSGNQLVETSPRFNVGQSTPADPTAKTAPVSHDAVPDAYRALVQDYFSDR